MSTWKCLVGSLGIVTALWLAPSAGAATATIGQADPVPPASSDTCDGCSAFQLSTNAGSPSYVVPPLPASGNPWTLTSWSARGTAGLAVGTARAQIWRPTSTTGQFQLVAVTGDGTFPPGVVTSISASIPVQPGDVLGVRSGDGDTFASSYDSASANDVDRGVFGDPAVGQTTGTPSSDLGSDTFTNARVNAAATLTSPDPETAPAVHKKKCKKKHKKRAAESKKKKCKKHKKK